MAALFYTWSQYTLSEANEDIGEVLGSIAQGLPSLGYTNVQHAQDVVGEKINVVLAVVYLYIGGRLFWQVVVCTVDGTIAEAEKEHDKVTHLIANLVFL
jgi:hypothetical protein